MIDSDDEGPPPVADSMATVYVKSDNRLRLMARKVSIQPKVGLGADFPSSRFFASNTSLPTSPIHASPVRTPHLRRSVEYSTCPLFETPVIEFAQLNYSYPAQLQTTGTAIGGYSSSHVKFIWTFPMISVSLSISSAELNRADKDVLTIAPLIKLTTVQYTYYKDILSRLMPAIEHEVNARYRSRFESFDEHGAKAGGFFGTGMGSKQGSSYLTRFASAENLLQGLNSFLIDKKADKLTNKLALDRTTATAITTMHKANALIPRESVLEKIILTMSDREIMISEMLKQQNQEKWDRKNLSHLIDYIQENDAFSELKRASSGSLVFKNYEKEKSRGKRAPWEVSQHHVNLDYAALKKEYFGKKGSGAAGGQGIAETAAADPEAAPGDGQGPVEGIASSAKADILTVSMSMSMDMSKAAHESVLVDDAMHIETVYPLTPTAAGMPALVKSKAARPQTAPNRPKPTATATNPLPVSMPQATATPKPVRVLSASVLRPMSAIGSSRPISGQQQYPDSPSSTMHKLQAHSRIDGLIDELESMTMKAASAASRAAPRPRPRTAFAHRSSSDHHQVDDAMTIASEKTTAERREALLLQGAAETLAFTSNKQRVDAIGKRFEDVMLTLKSSQNSYQHYDPLRTKRMNELAKHKRKQQLRAKVSTEGNAYVEDERFEGIIDMEKESKKLENKHLIAQSRATGRRTGYGLYKYADLIKFIHFLQFLSEVDIGMYERNVMYFYDEVGTDISKYVREQPYYLVDEILLWVAGLFGESDSAKMLQEALLFYRDEVPKSPRIALFNLIGIIFAMSKPWGVQLRIYMFVTAAHMLYKVMKSALPPKDQRGGAGGDGAALEGGGGMEEDDKLALLPMR